jgi:hypothetical protein
MGVEILPNFISTTFEVGEKVVKMSSNERQLYRDVVEKTFELLDGAVVLVILRLGDVLVKAKTDKDEFLMELGKLDNFEEWLSTERKVGLCSQLKASGCEMDSLWTGLKDRLSLKNRDDLQRLIESVKGGGRKLDAPLLEF